MTPAAKAAAELLKRRQYDEQGGRLDEAIRPTSIDEALTIQSEIVKQKNDDVVGGWKCVLPLENGNIIVAPIFKSEIQTDSPCLLSSDNGSAMVEPEIAFILGEDLPACVDGYSEETIDNAIVSCHMALELTKPRYAADSGFDYYEMFADCFINQGIFLGPKIDKTTVYDLAKVRIAISDPKGTEEHDGVHPNLSAHKPIYWLINTMTKRGIDFVKGQAIITGSYLGLVELQFDTPYEIEYVGVGAYSVVFSERGIRG